MWVMTSTKVRGYTHPDPTGRKRKSRDENKWSHAKRGEVKPSVFLLRCIKVSGERAMTTMQEARAYRWTELDKDAPMALLERRRIIGTQAMISHVTLRQGCFVPTHAHVNEQFSCILSGRLLFGLGADGAADRHELIVGPGEIMHLPSNVPHSAQALEETVVLDIFSPPSATTGIDRK